jgi:hypothetical protein
MSVLGFNLLPSLDEDNIFTIATTDIIIAYSSVVNDNSLNDHSG